MSTNTANERILLTGATGYLGGRLLQALEDADRRVRCMARRPEFLKPRVGSQTEVVYGDVLEPESLDAALEGVSAAFYLIHSMASRGDFEEEDRRAATAFAEAAKRAGVKRIIYLGGLGEERDLSSHLASRQEVGRILRESGVPTIEFRASIIIGSGSLSFEMIRSLVGKLPVMTTPKWVSSLAQPIAIEDVIAYMMAALDYETVQSEVFEIGGADQASYRDIMTEYARQRGLKRYFISVPVLTPGLSSLWLGLVTPIYARVGRKLIDSLRNATVVHDKRALDVFPIRPRNLRQAIERALVNEDREFAQTRWSDALSSSGASSSWGGIRVGSRIVDTRSIDVPVSVEQAFSPIRRIGGDTGWYFATLLWRIRGWFDLLLGGPGMRRGRRDPENPIGGDTLDFWRVEEHQRNHVLRLFAEMKVPGRAWLQFEVESVAGGSRIHQTAIFEPKGLMGPLYWYGLYPIHKVIFAGMLRGIGKAAVAEGAVAPMAAGS
ncbi:MAG: SDR family oxidoreductase [Acidobacteria bacterium]|nr:SDR family oxidoreductase [Acidobacteriota bacterium]